jgi:hypothetical protein
LKKESELNTELFIKSIIEVVHKSSISDVNSVLNKKPPGRGRQEKALELHNWYLNLDEKSKVNIADVIEQSVHASIFGFLATLDGSRGIEDGDKEGEFKLTYKNTDGTFDLSKAMDLHDEYQAQIYNKVFGK